MLRARMKRFVAMMRAPAAALLLVVVGGCLRGGEDRAVDDLAIGVGRAGGVGFEVVDGLGHWLVLEPERWELWAQAPVLEILVTAPSTARAAALICNNCLADAVLTASDPSVGIAADDEPDARSTQRRWLVQPAGTREFTLRIAPPDAAEQTAWRFAVMGDIQEALDEVDDVFATIAADPSIRFVVSTGDIVQAAESAEYELFSAQLAALPVPYYSTIGNHELWEDPRRFQRRFGRYNVHFEFRGVVFSLVDSANASIDPLVYDWLQDWLNAAADRVHLFFTHFPPLDPIGVRAGSFRSVREAQKLLARLARGGVDLTFYGHIHSYYAFENAGIPAYISGGGGALPERWDGIGRHFLTVDVDADRVIAVGVTRVD